MNHSLSSRWFVTNNEGNQQHNGNQNFRANDDVDHAVVEGETLHLLADTVKRTMDEYHRLLVHLSQC